MKNNLPSSIQTLKGKWISPHIYNLQINRPEKLNSMNFQFFDELPQAVKFLNEQNELRVVILTGNGKHFSVGLDLTESMLSHIDEKNDHARQSIMIYSLIKKWQNSISSLSNCRVPVIVGIHNACIGGAIDLISACDIRYCTKDTKFCIKEVDIGICADLGTVQVIFYLFLIIFLYKKRIPLLTGNDSIFRELNYTGRTFDFQEAQQLGLISKSVENKDEMMKDLLKLAEDISSKSPVAVWTIKQSLNHDLNQIVEKNLDYIARINAAMLNTTDVQECVNAFFQKRKPIFPKL
ncbi:hypothetical protein IMG5_163560 [Ichthyophthirius multifiliis]|uniref:Enoyl-CoA hydratase n=1 Tax=Ichthyophthirius multifiliis TaxID=5932 RepID=G0R0C9_ICHMU|nr:hypothetical protein IMG5_163560 [Ichthyophthirius multifiliis]EGR29066.1 hypothetical protein IMG5_163560 [Ichthyophthirius multifiliis]|eukprot:XP_004030302.1 hypothetical protein IMG5_163560 [Ichthyophthirius multifiliis]